MSDSREAPVKDEALKPCPHCGEKEELYPCYRQTAFQIAAKPYAIDCLGCGFEFVPREGMDVIEKWNTRVANARDEADYFATDARLAESERLLQRVREWLSGWASAEPYLSDIDAFLKGAKE